jgi:hypothetical protein
MMPSRAMALLASSTVLISTNANFFSWLMYTFTTASPVLARMWFRTHLRNKIYNREKHVQICPSPHMMPTEGCIAHSPHWLNCFRKKLDLVCYTELHWTE